MTNNEPVNFTEIFDRIEKGDVEFILTITKELYTNQPFLVSMMLGYYEEYEFEETGELIAITQVIWEYFKRRKSAWSVQVTQEQFEKFRDRNFSMIGYIENEPDKNEVMNIFSSDINKLESLPLFSALTVKIMTNSELSKLDDSTKGNLLIGCKSLIEYFEENDKNFLEQT